MCADAFKKGEIVCVQIFFFFRKKIREIVKCFGPLLFFYISPGSVNILKKKCLVKESFVSAFFRRAVCQTGELFLNYAFGAAFLSAES